jgi:hypothetical protein
MGTAARPETKGVQGRRPGHPAAPVADDWVSYVISFVAAGPLRVIPVVTAAGVVVLKSTGRKEAADIEPAASRQATATG